MTQLTFTSEPTSMTSRLVRGARRGLALALLPALAACEVTELVRATDPDIIGPENINSAGAANAMRLGTLARFNTITSGSESMFLYGGLAADEFRTGDTFIERVTTDQRAVVPQNGNILGAFRDLHRARVGAQQTRVALRQFDVGGPAWRIAEMYLVEAYALNLLAETFCNGVPISTIIDGVEQLGGPVSTADLYTRALAVADSGVAAIGTTTGTDVTRVLNALNVLRGRVLINQGNWAQAATAAAAVPTTWTWQQEHSLTTRSPGVWNLMNNQRRYIVADNEGPLAMNFGTAADPRVPTCLGASAACNAAGVANTTRPFDAASPLTLRVQLIWSAATSSVNVFSGIQARLFEAEAALNTNPANVVTILNAIRTSANIAGLPATLADPGTAAGRRDLLFREKGFWLYGLGFRFGDLRRLVRQYGLPVNSVWPNGGFLAGGNYGPDVNFPIPQAEANNDQVPSTGGIPQCTDRNP